MPGMHTALRLRREQAVVELEPLAHPRAGLAITSGWDRPVDDDRVQSSHRPADMQKVICCRMRHLKMPLCRVLSG